jgi:hypothetical protein
VNDGPCDISGISAPSKPGVFVCENGLDSNNGLTKEAPVRTLTKAVSIMRTESEFDALRIYLLPGELELASDQTIDVQSGVFVRREKKFRGFFLLNDQFFHHFSHNYFFSSSLQFHNVSV